MRLLLAKFGQVLALHLPLHRVHWLDHLLVEAFELAIVRVGHELPLSTRTLGEELTLRRRLNWLVVHVPVDV